MDSRYDWRQSSKAKVTIGPGAKVRGKCDNWGWFLAVGELGREVEWMQELNLTMEKTDVSE